MPNLINDYIIPADKTPDYLILIVALFLIIGVWSLIVFFVAKKTPLASNISDVKAYEVCPIGDCPTNRQTGQKRCPKNTAQPIQYNPIIETCNPIGGCTDTSTPYAVQTDGSTDLSGTCDVDGCRCVNYLQTPSYTQVIFNMTNGNLYSPYSEQQGRIIFTQTPSPYVGEGNNVPQLYQDPQTQFFEIAPSLISYLTPNTCKINFINTPDPGTDQLLECINTNPCLSGRLAYVPTNSSTFTAFGNTDLNGTVPLACVPNSVENPPDAVNFPNSCQNSIISPIQFHYAPVFNSSNGKIFCHKTDIPIVV